METNWIIIILIIVAIVVLIIFLILKNKKDTKKLMRHLIDEDSISLSKRKHDNDETDYED